VRPDPGVGGIARDPKDDKYIAAAACFVRGSEALAAHHAPSSSACWRPAWRHLSRTRHAPRGRRTEASTGDPEALRGLDLDAL